MRLTCYVVNCCYQIRVELSGVHHLQAVDTLAGTQAIEFHEKRGKVTIVVWSHSVGPTLTFAKWVVDITR